MFAGGTANDTGVKDEAVDIGVDRGSGRLSVGTGHGGSAQVLWRHRQHRPWKGQFIYNYAASQDQLRDDPNVALFFLDKDLHPSKTVNLRFTKTTSGAKLLPGMLLKPYPSHRTRSQPF